MKKILFKILFITSFLFCSTNLAEASFNTNLNSIYDGNEKILESIIETKEYLPIRVLLSIPKNFQYFIIDSKEEFIITQNKTTEKYKTKIAGIIKHGNNLYLLYKNKENIELLENLNSVQILSTKKEQVLRVKNWNRIPSWDKSKMINDNIFLGGFDIRVDNGFLNLVNELNLKDYMRGIAEVPEKDLEEKRKALQVISRSYAKYYITQSNYLKFPGKHYNASDNPNVFQKYRGYGFTLRSPEWQKSLKEVGEKVLMHKGKTLRAAYFSCTPANGFTKTPAEAGWNDSYFLKETQSVYKSIEDKIGIDSSRVNKAGACGHGVGLSGYGATIMAKEGKNYQEILKHYYQEVEIK